MSILTRLGLVFLIGAGILAICIALTSSLVALVVYPNRMPELGKLLAIKGLILSFVLELGGFMLLLIGSLIEDGFPK